METLNKVKKVHLIGLGGIGVSAAAKLLFHNGIEVSGSDAVSSSITQELSELGIKVHIGSSAENLPMDVDLVIRSGAVPDSDPELIAARKRGIRDLTYFQFLGEYTANKRVIAVAGTHGKSTTTAMLGLILIEAGLDPTVIVGSKVAAFPDGNLRLGKSDLVVVEACEHEAHMLEFHPWAIIINNIEADHLDFYRDLNHIKQTFQQFVDQLAADGLLVLNGEDSGCTDLLKRNESKAITFGFNQSVDYRAGEVKVNLGRQEFALWHKDQKLAELELSVPGKFNIANALAATSLALELGVSVEIVRSALSAYRGIWRRFEIIGRTQGMTIVSDYGHHPTAVTATLRAAHDFYPEQPVVLIFQPHHHNRTRKLFDDFVASFDQADAVILLEIYDVKGREQDDDAEVSSKQLVEAVLERDTLRGIRRPVKYASDLVEASNLLLMLQQSDSIVLVVGAGDIDNLARRLVD
jgi:UDP-N-acetylmuramate--alanine ligase